MSVAQVNNGALPKVNVAIQKKENQSRPVLITGGAGFLGTNLAHRLLSLGKPVLLFDNLSRPGVERNWQWLCSKHGSRVKLQIADVRDFSALRRAASQACQVFHFAAQVAVTSSLLDPVADFEVNARGTLNLLEALREQDPPPPLLYTSTNKIYGDLGWVSLRANRSRYEPEDAQVKQEGFGELTPLQFHSPYGCSKGAACQYVLDYCRTFDLPTVVFCMSCIYGLHQFGTEDQGWVAHFLIRALQERPITIYGDGKQVRDILFVDDLVDAFLLAQKHIKQLAGQAFNIGGGPENTISLLELLDIISEIKSTRPHVRFEDWRAADQRFYVSDITRFCNATGWRPQVGVCQGIERLYHWLECEGIATTNLPATSTAENGRSDWDENSRRTTRTGNSDRSSEDLSHCQT